MIKDDWIRFFSLPAMVHHIQSLANGPLLSALENVKTLHEEALNAYFDYIPDKARGGNPIMKFHKSLTTFFKYLSLPPDTRQNTQAESTFNQLKNKVIKHFYNADIIHLISAFSSLYPDTQQFIKKAEIQFGVFVLRPPAETIIDMLNIDSHTQQIAALLFKNPPYLTLFQCTYRNKKHIYALQSSAGGYVVKQVDKDFSHYYPLLTDEDKNQAQGNTLVVATFSAPKKTVSDLHWKEKLAALFAKKHQTAFTNALDSIDDDEDDRQFIKQQLLSQSNVPLVYFFNAGADKDASPLPLTCVNDYAIRRLIPFNFFPSGHLDNSQTGPGIVKAFTQPFTFESLALALATQKSFEEIPADTKEFYSNFSQASAKTRRLWLQEIISDGMSRSFTNDTLLPRFCLNNLDVYRTLAISNAGKREIGEIQWPLQKVNDLTHDAYSRLPTDLHSIRVSDDHVSQSVDAAENAHRV